MFHFTCAFAGARYVVVFLIRSCGYTRIEQRNDAACPRSGADHWTCPGARPTPSWPPLVGRPCGRLEEANCIGRPISSAPARTQKTLSERREFPNGDRRAAVSKDGHLRVPGYATPDVTRESASKANILVQRESKPRDALMELSLGIAAAQWCPMVIGEHHSPNVDAMDVHECVEVGDMSCDQIERTLTWICLNAYIQPYTTHKTENVTRRAEFRRLYTNFGASKGPSSSPRRRSWRPTARPS